MFRPKGLHQLYRNNNNLYCLISGHGDVCYTGKRVGCYNLLTTIQNRVKPSYHVFGHVHEG